MQRFGDGPGNELSLESFGDYTRKVGHIKFSDFNNETRNGKSVPNLLNNVWYQPEEVFPVHGTPEVRQHAFWVPVNPKFFAVAKDLEVIGTNKPTNFLYIYISFVGVLIIWN